MKFFKKKSNISKYFDYLLKGIYAGIMIGIGGIAYLKVSNNIAGSFLFSIGLLTICMYQMNLYTGKIGYILINKFEYVYELLLSLIGNFIGTFLVGTVINFTRGNDILTKAQKIVDIKLNDSLVSIFILSVFCGILMYIAVNNYKNSKNEIGKYIGIFMCVMTFILCGFEHCVANMFYIVAAKMLSLKSLLYLLIMILGNSCGSILIALFYNRYYKN